MKIIRLISSTTRRIVQRPPPIIIPNSPPRIQAPILPPVDEHPPHASSSTALPLEAPPKKGNKKRALLIGIRHQPPGTSKPPPSAKLGKRLSMKVQEVQQAVQEKFSKPREQMLLGCHKDVKAMKGILIKLYGYKEEDITMLMDGDENDCLPPTEENILKHLDELVANAEPGDRFFFHFSGHSTQEDTDDPDEEDGKNEFILTCDDKTIGDNVLHDKLVRPLPIGARLTAIFDTCHSATMLDLQHYRCNRVYVPWMNKGKRGSLTQQNAVVRKYAKLLSPHPSDNSNAAKRRRLPTVFRRSSKKPSSGISQVLESPVQSKSGSGPRRLVERRRNVRMDDGSGGGGDAQTPVSAYPQEEWLAELGGPRCSSPEKAFCEGWCSPMRDGHLHFPEVITLSAAKDGQRAWEDSQGSCMTQVLVKRLQKEPNPLLHDLLSGVSHDLHHLYLDIHANSKTYKKKARQANEKRIARGRPKREPEEVEMDNFQNPQISSLYPLDTRAQLWSP